ncbi:hypothetical protein OBBRIDRAFT_578097 [Obba rivulosa]|uniref:Uncharacterized protein n=1 Tax=Obba rivulosa TaxID=1052685 RepID=A0A8E2DTJ7_9APHY|nr:hypothetical protein OBBRIDRAFT_578097 [Obba rivulosa]
MTSNVYYHVDDDPGLWKRVTAQEQRVRIRGYNAEAAAAIKACTASGEDYIDTPWGSLDLVSCIMRRLEERLKIPTIYWRLAAEGRILHPGIFTCIHLLFRGRDRVELELVPGNAIEHYLTEHEETASTEKSMPSPESCSTCRHASSIIYRS